MRCLGPCLMLVLLATIPAIAALRHVPSEYSTIQAGIIASANGDTVLVAPGVYHEYLDFLGRLICLKSDLGPDVTIIEGQGSDQALLSLLHNENRSAVITGFTFRNSSNAPAITISNASPTIKNNLFSNNSSGAGAISAVSNSFPEIRDNIFEYNGSFGAIYIFQSDAIIAGNIFRYNFSDTHGGAIFIRQSSLSEVHHNVFFENRCLALGGAICLSECPGGTLYNNTIAFNYNTQFEHGAGLTVWYSNNWAIFNNIIVNNNGKGLYSFPSNNSQATFNDVWGNTLDYDGITPGNGSISADPVFINSDPFGFYLQPQSPCINAGDPNPIYNDPDGSRADIGAYPFYNCPPEMPVLVSPENGVLVDSAAWLTWLMLNWDRDCQYFYGIQIDDNSQFDSPEIDIDSIIPSSFLLEHSISFRLSLLAGFDNLRDGIIYYWKVRERNNIGENSPWSESFQFNFESTNNEPFPPESGFSPATGEEVISLRPIFTWNNAADPDHDDHPGTLSYTIRLSTDTIFAGFVFYDTTPPGINQISPVYDLDDNSHYFYQVKTIDDGGLTSDWSVTQDFWTNHYNFPPEAFPLFGPLAGAKQVDYYTQFSWGSTVDHDPNSSFTYSIETTNDSLFRYVFWSRDSLTDTSLTIATDSLINVGAFYWRILATDDDSLVRIGGIPEGPKYLMILPPGDANTNGVTNGLDVTFLVNYFKGYGPVPDPILAGDANGSCVINGIDVTYLVNYLKGLGGAPVRGNCETAY